MGFKTTLVNLLAAVPLALAHGDHIALGPIERRDLKHCERHFKEPEFVKRTVEIHGRELARLRRNLGLDTEELDTYVGTSDGWRVLPLSMTD